MLQPSGKGYLPAGGCRAVFISEKRDNYFITVSRLVSYKRLDVIIQAFNELKLPLLIIGEGPSKGC